MKKHIFQILFQSYTNKRMPYRVRGGKILGIGGEGCVYGPAFDNDSEYVTKVLNSKSANAEAETSLFLNELDPSGLYGNYVVSRDCDISMYIPRLKTEFRADPTVNRLQFCEKMAKSPKGYCALKVKKFTSDLYDYNGSLTKAELLQAWINIFEAFKFINNNFVAHLDVKRENMAYQATNDKKHAFILSDWGFSKFLKTCSQVNTVFNEFRNRVIQVGDGYTPWNPNVKSPIVTDFTCEQKRNFLFLNDISAAAQAMVQFIRQTMIPKRLGQRADYEMLFMLADRIYDNLIDFVDTPSYEVADLFIEELRRLM
jgi:serine/threonine protein kinase